MDRWPARSAEVASSMKPGDMVQLRDWFPKETPLFSTWGNKEGGDKLVGSLRPYEVGVVLESSALPGGNGVRIIAAGKIGWINMYLLEHL